MPSPDAPARSTEGLAARRAALSILDAVLRTGQTMDNAAMRWSAKLPPNDYQLALALSGETLRRIPDLDALIDSRTRQILPPDAKARMVLRLAMAQKIATQIPDHAIVATALPLVEGGPRRLVHGVLSALLKRPIDESDSAMLPAEVEDRWRSAWGEEAIAAARRSILRRPPLDLSFADEAAAKAFAAAHDGVSLAPLHVRLTSAVRVSDLPGFGEGGWWVQDIASSLPARLIPSKAKTVLDACAAPGGKTMQLAAVGHDVTALDRSESRLARLSENLLRTHLTAHMVTADALDWQAPSQFDAVLLDAPCSATGTFRRHPEVLYRASARFIAESAELQTALLNQSAQWVRPGGSLVYAVCSLEREEGEQRIEQFLADHGEFSLSPAPGLADGVTPSKRGWVRVLPGMLEEQGGIDGFFAAHLVRTA